MKVEGGKTNKPKMPKKKPAVAKNQSKTIKARKPTKTNKNVLHESAALRSADPAPFFKAKTSKRSIQSYIDNLDISADAKHVVSSVLDITIKIGNQVVKIGIRIIEVALEITRSFPNTTFGLVLGLLVWFLILSVPLLGAVLGALLGPIVLAFSLSKGFMEDMSNKTLENKITEAVEMFKPLGVQ